jgi:hypothetical protein
MRRARHAGCGEMWWQPFLAANAGGLASGFSQLKERNSSKQNAEATVKYRESAEPAGAGKPSHSPEAHCFSSWVTQSSSKSMLLTTSRRFGQEKVIAS